MRCSCFLFLGLRCLFSTRLDKAAVVPTGEFVDTVLVVNNFIIDVYDKPIGWDRHRAEAIKCYLIDTILNRFETGDAVLQWWVELKRRVSGCNVKSRLLTI